MRQGPNGRRPRGRHHGGGHGGQGGGERGNSGPRMGGGGGDNRPRSAASLRHQTFDSNCIDLRVRGNAWQVHEKYQALARDAQSSGDRVTAENYLQHAEHYYRIIEAINEATAAEQQARGGAPVPFGQQPDVPNNYYGAQGGLAAPGNPGNTTAPGSSDASGNSSQAPAQAEVQVRNPPQSPFFTPEEAEEQHGSNQPLAANR
jgi:Domain of unknown function (DUF4167)